jgi:hypothetical protein
LNDAYLCRLGQCPVTELTSAALRHEVISGLLRRDDPKCPAWPGPIRSPWTPHKWLYQPLDCSALLYRDAGAARRAFAYTGEYARPMSGDPAEGFAFFEESVELSRRRFPGIVPQHVFHNDRTELSCGTICAWNGVLVTAAPGTVLGRPVC